MKKPIPFDLETLDIDALFGGRKSIPISPAARVIVDAALATRQTTITVAQGKLLEDTYWAHKDNPVRTFSHGGKQWAASGMQFQGGECTHYFAFSLTKRSEWKGDPAIVEDKQVYYDMWNRNEGERGDMTGLAVRLKGVAYVLGDRTEFITNVPPPPLVPLDWKAPGACPPAAVETETWNTLVEEFAVDAQRLIAQIPNPASLAGPVPEPENDDHDETSVFFTTPLWKIAAAMS